MNMGLLNLNAMDMASDILAVCCVQIRPSSVCKDSSEMKYPFVIPVTSTLLSWILNASKVFLNKSCISGASSFIWAICAAMAAASSIPITMEKVRSPETSCTSSIALLGSAFKCEIRFTLI